MKIVLDKLLGTGGASDVYNLGNGKVVKLYFEGFDKRQVEWEYNKTLDAYQNGLPTPQVFEIVELNNRFGLVMEKLEGKTLMEIMFAYIVENNNVSFV